MKFKDTLMPKGTTYMFHMTSCHLTISDKNRNRQDKSSQVLIKNFRNLHTLKFSMKTVDFFVLEMCPKAVFCTKIAQ